VIIDGAVCDVDTMTGQGEENEEGVLGRLTRRGVVWGAGVVGGAGLLSTDASAAAPGALDDDERQRWGWYRRRNTSEPDPYRRNRAAEAYQRRVALARDRLLRHDRTPITRNDDEESEYGDFVVGGERFDSPVASFTKGLPHDAYGEADPDAYDTLRGALNQDGDLKPRSFNGIARFDDIPVGGTRQLANPQAALSYDTTGFDPHDVYHEAAPAFASAESAAEMVELYWQALLRDVPFEGYGDHRGARAAAEELGGLEGYEGPGDDGGLQPENLFRGSLPGCTQGPHVSQFLYKFIPRGARMQDQKVPIAKPGVDYMTEYDDWLAVQNGQNPYDTSFRDAEEFVHDPELEERYIVTGRDLATYSHRNVPHQPYLAAALIALGDGVPLDDGVPLPDGIQNGNVDFARDEITSGIPGVNLPAQHAAWFHKWVAHRRLRPEEYGGRVYHTKRDEGPTYPVPDDLLDSTALEVTRREFDTYLLPQAYPEGSPTHPSFPAGHAAQAGAMGTLVKAYFDDTAVLPDPVKPDPEDPTRLVGIDEDLTLTGEVNKLVANLCIGRNWAGIHYRTDASDGIRMGERVAAAFLLDRVNSKRTDCAFQFQTFDGHQARIERGDEELPEAVMPEGNDVGGRDSPIEGERGRRDGSPEWFPNAFLGFFF
jgi:hypothetical protein